MLNVYLGNFHPDLEDALCKNISTLKEEDPLSPIAIIVPSGYIRSRLKNLLARERGMNLMGVQFLTFHGLAMRLYTEKYGLIRHLTGDDFFFEEFLRHGLRTGIAGGDTFHHFSETPEGCATLWTTLRDMKDAKVEPDNVIEAIKEGIFSAGDIEKITPLLLLYREFLLRKKCINITDYSDLAEIATELAPSSSYLRTFKEINYYGFYDLTQVQYDLFRTVLQHYSTTLYFPFVDGMSAFSFARRFYEGYIQGIAADPKGIKRLSDATPSKTGSETLFPFGYRTTIISASGTVDEVLTTAKVILKLVDEEGYGFSDIGVVAREINEYGHLVKRIFDTHRIPFVSSASEPVNRYQLTKAVHLLLSIPVEGYRRPDIIDLASSHYCKIGSFCPAGVDPAPDIWDVVTRSIGISKGYKEWERLDQYLREGFILHEDEEGEESHRVNGAELEGIKRLVVSLKEDFSSLPPAGSWSGYVERFRGLIRKYIAVQGFVEEALLSLGEFDVISSEVTLSGFIETFRRSLDSKYIPIGDKNIDGVQVLDAMSARGIFFKVLFLLGMNEKVFPRNIREDPLLRDSARGVLESGLGYKIAEKLFGFEEEKLLFYLLLSSARERIYLLYQRTDEAGQIKVPSWYLSEIKRGYPVKENRVPRRMADKFSSSEFFNYHLLTPGELSIRLILEGIDPDPVISRFNLHPALFRHGLKTIQLFEEMEPRLTEFDGLTGPIDSHWNSIIQRGTSPTSLEMYARCPFSYFAHHVLDLRRLNRPEGVFEIPPAEIGNICHKILKRFYMRGADILDPGMDINRYLQEDASMVFSEFQQSNPVGYPLIWEVLQDRLLTILKSVIEDDRRELASSGFIPHSFEVDATGYFTQDVPEYMRDICVHGVLDRIDIKRDSSVFRIIDYKFKSGRRVNSEDKNLPLAAVRGKRLQPPVYLLMAIPYLEYTCGIEGPLPEKASFYFIAPNWSIQEDGETRSDFPGNCWQSPLGEQIKDTMALLLRGIREGLFFIFPDGYCDYCDYSAICRKNHFPSRWRAERDERVKPYHSIRHSKI